MGEKNGIFTPLKAIRAYCIYSCKNGRKDVKYCGEYDCQLHPYRMGKNPNQHTELTEEQKAELRERVAKAREKRLSALRKAP